MGNKGRNDWRHNHGFSLVEIAIVLVILGVLLTMTAGFLTATQRNAKLTTTKNRMTLVESALVQFVAQNRRLPCPADGTLASANVGAGKEGTRNGTGCVSQTNGVIPWRDLGISETDATDEWLRRFSYRVGEPLTKAEGMNMSLCDPAAPRPDNGAAPFTWQPASSCAACTAATIMTCTSPNNWLTTKGLGIADIAGTALMVTTPTAALLPDLPAPQGAAFVLISHGETGGGGYTSAGVLSASSTIDGTAEQTNYANVALRTSYTDDNTSDTAGANHFDDLVIRPSIMTVATRAGLQPRSHP